MISTPARQFDTKREIIIIKNTRAIMVINDHLIKVI